MSNNTNTLFWVITGAVTTLSTFLLVNNTSDNKITTISDSFSGYANRMISSQSSDIKRKYYSHEPDYEDLIIESEELFTFDSDNQTITGYTGTSEIIVFPSTINGVEVKKIGNLKLNTNYNNAKNCENIKRIHENNPDNASYTRRYNDLVNSGIIVDGVCQERVLPTKIVLPNTITEIQRDLITSVQTIKELVIPSSVEVIANNAITNSSLEKLDLSNSTNLKSIGWCALAGNKINGTLVIPESVTFIDSMAFQNNDINHVIFKANINTMPSYLFTGNKNLEDIKIYNNNLSFPSLMEGRETVFDQEVWYKLKVYVPTESMSFYQNQPAMSFYILEGLNE